MAADPKDYENEDSRLRVIENLEPRNSPVEYALRLLEKYGLGASYIKALIQDVQKYQVTTMLHGMLKEIETELRISGQNEPANVVAMKRVDLIVQRLYDLHNIKPK